MNSSMSGSQGSTKGFLSNNSQSIIENSRGPSLSEKIHANLFYLSTNIHRYTGFSSKWIAFSAIFRILQNYATIFMPGCKSFWGSDSRAEIIILIVTLPLHLCFARGNSAYHAVLSILYTLILFFCLAVLASFLLRDPHQKSFTNKEIYLISFLFGVIVPIFSTFALSTFGACVKHIAFLGDNDILSIFGVIFGAFAFIISIPLNILSMALIRARSSIDMKTFYATWGSRVHIYFLVDYTFQLCSFFEECLPIDRKYYLIAFCGLLFLTSNPLTIIIALFDGNFQRFHDAAYFCSQICSTMLAILLMLMQIWVKTLTPAYVIITEIIGFMIFLAIFNLDLLVRERKILNKMNHIYHSNHAILPSLSPLIFTNPEQVHVGFSQEAYNTLQAFDTLNIKTAVEFHRYVSIGADAKLPAVTNLDFIKWGLIKFNDYATLVDSAQICQYFGDTSQVLPIIIQHIRESPEKGFFKAFAINIIESLHTDSISDSPQLFKMIEEKANGGLTRTRRMISVFWGCVLNHSIPSMKEALCKMRDSITETEAHFDELTRCYPYSDSTINLMLTFLTELRGYYDAAERYINSVSSHFIERSLEEMTTEDNSKNNDIMGEILNNKSKSYYPFTSELSNYMEQERVATKTSQAPMVALWTLGVFSLLAIIGCFIFVIAKTLSTFSTYPKYLKIVDGCNEAITNLASMTIGARRMCLFSHNLIKTTDKQIPVSQDASDRSAFYNYSTMLPYLLENIEKLTISLQKFYQEAAYSDEMLYSIEHKKTSFVFYGNQFNGSLSFALDLMANSLRNVVGNIPMLFEDQQMKHPFSLDGPTYLPDAISSAEVHQKRAAYLNLLYQKRKEAAKNLHEDFDETDLSFIDKDHLPEIQNITTTFKNRTVTIMYDPVEMFKASCQSACIKHLILNVKPIADLLLRFFMDFEDLSKDKVDDLSEILKWSMIIMPVAFIVLFITAVIICSYFVIQESNFRTTLYLSLPEQIASEIFRAGGQTYKAHQKIKKTLGGAEGNEAEKELSDEKDKQSVSSKSPEIELLKEKARNIESLHQFSSVTNGINGTGIYHFIGWSIIYIIIGALAMFILTLYAKDINDGFFGRAVMIVESAMRFLRLLYATLYTFEFFFQQDNIKLVDPNNILAMNARLVGGAIKSHQTLTYGNVNVSYSFREYKEVENVILSKLADTRANTTAETFKSFGSLQHDSYKNFGFDTKFRIYCQYISAIAHNFANNLSAYSLNDEIWQHFEHLFFVHLLDETVDTVTYYMDGVSGVISKSLIISLVISLSALVILLLIFGWPINKALTALGDYFDLTLHMICTIPPAVFGRSIYIEKWLKGEVNAFNYKQYESNFKRTVSASLQNQIIDESPEKLFVFNTKGEYIPINDKEQFQENASIQDVLAELIDNHEALMPGIEAAYQKIIDAKDAVENQTFKSLSKEGNPIKIIMRGIPTSETDVSSTNVIKYYAYVAILTRDITQEQTSLDEYKKQKDHTILLLSRSVPSAFAKRMHDGERRIKFSAGIGSVLNIEIIDFETTVMSQPPENVQRILVDIREFVNRLLEENKNMSLVKINRGLLTFVAGLFNDEQNGRTEALDSIRFSAFLASGIKEIFEREKINTGLRFGISTGGPIYCKVLMDITPFIIVSDEISSLSNVIVKNGKVDTLLLDRTTYECIYGVNIDAQISGDIDFNGKHITLYAVNIPDLINSMQQPQA